MVWKLLSAFLKPLQAEQFTPGCPLPPTWHRVSILNLQKEEWERHGEKRETAGERRKKDIISVTEEEIGGEKSRDGERKCWLWEMEIVNLSIHPYIQQFPHLQDFIHSDSSHTHSLFYLKCETTSVMLPKQSVANTESQDSQWKHLSPIIHLLFWWVFLFCSVNSWVHYRCQGTRKISLPLTARGTDPGLVSWGLYAASHLQQLWLFAIILFLLVKLFILIVQWADQSSSLVHRTSLHRTTTTIFSVVYK